MANWKAIDALDAELKGESKSSKWAAIDELDEQLAVKGSASAKWDAIDKIGTVTESESAPASIEPSVDVKSLRDRPVESSPDEPISTQALKAVQNTRALRVGETVKLPEFDAPPITPSGVLQTVGGLAVGSIEWLLSNVAALEAAAYHQVIGGMTSEEALDRGYKDVENLFISLHEKLPESIGKYLGSPTDPGAQDILSGVTWFIENTAGWAGTKTGELLKGTLEAGADYVGEETTAGVILDGAAPWAYYISKFGTELVLFKGAHKVGSYIGKKAGKGQLPPRTVEDFIAERNKPPSERVPPSDLEIVRTLEQEFDKPAAARKAAIDITREEAGGVTIEAGISIREQLEVQGRKFETTSAERNLKAAQDNYASALKLKNEGALLETNRGTELITQGVDPALVPNQIMSEMAAGVHRAQVRLDNVTGKAAEVTAEIGKATTAAREAAQTGELPANYIGSSIDPVSGSWLPYGNSLAARSAAVKHAETGVITRVRKVPNTKNFVLEVLEESGRRISGRKGDYTETGAKRQQTVLANKGVKTELVPTEKGYVLEVKGYSVEAAKNRLAQLRKAPAPKVQERPEPVTVRLTKEREKSPKERYKDIKQEKVRTSITPEERQLIAERIEYYLAQPVGSGKVLMDTIARETKAPVEAVRSTFYDMTGFYAESLIPEMTFLHAGLPISPELAKKISDAALRAGVHTSEFLQRKGYDAETALRITEAVESLSGKSKHAVAEVPTELKDTTHNRKAMRRSIHQLAESEGLETSKPTKRGKPLGEFPLSELTAVAREAGLPSDALLKDLTPMMRGQKKLRHTEFLHEDKGLAEFVKKATGKEWGDNLNIRDLTAIRNKLLSMKTVPGKHIIKQNGGQPPVTDYHLQMMARIANEKPQGFIEGSVWFADRVDKVAPGFGDTFLWPFQKAWHNATKDFMHDRSIMRQKIKELNLKKSDLRHIGQYAIWKQPEGKAFLQNVEGVKIAPKLTPEQKAFYEYMRNDVFEPIFAQINQARAAAGLAPIKYTENYFSFFRDLTEAAKEGFDVMNSSASAIQDYMVNSRQTYFQNAKPRVARSELPIAKNAQNVLERYMLNAHRHIRLTPELSYARAIIGTTFERAKLVEKFGEGVWPTELVGKSRFRLDDTTSGAAMASGINRYLNYIAGIPPKSVFPPIMHKVASAVSRNMVYSTLSMAFGSAMRQFGAWRLTLAEFGPVNLMKGVMRAATDFTVAERGTRFGEGKFQRGARAKSEQLLTRVFDASAQHMLDVLEGTRSAGSYLSYMRDKVGKAGLKPLLFADEIAAVVGWYAAEAKGKKLGLEGKELTAFADKWLVKTQGSGTRIAVPPVMRDTVTRAAMLFQTYVLNEWSYLTREVLGLKSSKPTLGKVKKVMYFVAATTAMNVAFEALGVRSPFPTPIRTFMESQERGDSTMESIASTAFEIVEPVPAIGGALRFGTGLFGPIASTFADFSRALHGDPFTPPIIVSAAKLAGVPGMNAFWKGYRELAIQTDNNIRRRRSRRKRRRRR